MPVVLGSFRHQRNIDRQASADKFMIAKSEITCPHCGIKKSETMPTDACMFFYECSGCKALLRPQSGDCCVFCSYGSVPCPPVQEPRVSDCCRANSD